MPVVLLVRHGQASIHADDYDVLSELGREQARVVGNELTRRDLRNPLVMTGSLRRQRDTAAEALPAARPTVDERWNEYDYLQLLGHRPVPADRIAAFDSAVPDEVDADLAAIEEQAQTALKDFVARLQPGQDGIVFTSAGVIGAVAARLFGAGPSGVIEMMRLVVNGSISKLIIGKRGTSLLTFNDHAHFDGERRAMMTYA